MKFCIIMGSPRINGNTAELCRPFIAEIEKRGAEAMYFVAAGMDIAPCRGCYVCQDATGEYGCAQKDDMQKIVESILWSDCVVIATPIYTWFCPTQLKSVLDRLYGMNKFYGRGKGSLWAGKRMALITTHGYDAEYGAGPFETGIKRLCEHSGLIYSGMYFVRDTDNIASFQTAEARNGIVRFADSLICEPAKLKKNKIFSR